MAILVQSNKKPSVSYPEQTGSIVTFNSQYAGLPLKSHKIALTATQSGSGTPSPDNVRNIVGVSSVNIGQTSGYGEYFQGLLNGTYAYREFDGSENWKISSTGNNYYFEIGANVMIADTIIANEFDNIHRAPTVDYIGIYNTARFIQLRPSTAELDLEAWKIWLNDNHLFVIYKLVNQTTPTITPQEFATLCQAFGITGNTYPITFGQTVYGGEYDARTGVLTITHGFIASYNGETINEPWISSMDEYVEGGTPTSGAQVVYPLSTPQTIQLQPCPIDTLEGVNNIWADTGDTTAQYIKIGG
jgi:hypothetical protein